MKPRKLPGIGIIVFVLILLCVTGCPSRHFPSPDYRPPVPEKKLSRMGYTIQVGAFARVENAARLANRLNSDNLDAYYFLYKQGLYKVRFGNFASRELAAREAEILKAMGVIGPYYIVPPEEYAITKRPYGDDLLFRDEIVRTARSFIGVPYQWGGASAERGFDCSGLAMAIYRLNGLNLPRTSGQQYGAGTSVSREDLAKGDLVFFDTRGRGMVSHVGIYAGQGRFIHAPRTGKTVRTSSLSNTYYKNRYIGARTYL
ncbi:MAG: NlpC/P60 family protein [Syntrophales bacterium]|nr:NlpC/P60 family protein [Syntrophales bacterium]